MQSVTIIGTGNVGGALCLALDSVGLEIKHLVSGPTGKVSIDLSGLKSTPRVSRIENIGNVKADVMFLAVSDNSDRSSRE